MSERFTKMDGTFYYTRDITADDAGATLLPMRVKPGMYIGGVKLVVTESFNTTGALSVGDADDAEAWIPAADVGQTAGVYTSTTAAYAAGRRYDDEINLVVTVASGVSAGNCYVLAGPILDFGS